jgi:Arc/MetJ-type ribon-helix-helix transcriptional regulator
MSTELITFKLEKDFLKNVDDTVKSAGYHSRTEFIRDSLRAKIDEVKTKAVFLALDNMKGKASKKVSDETLRKIREQVSNKYDNKFK